MGLSRRALTQSVEQAPDSILITDAELDLPGPRILFANQAFSDLTGYSTDELLGETPRVLQGPGTERSVLDRLRRDLESGRSFVGEALNYRKDGSAFRLRWHISPVSDPVQGLVGYVAIQRDVSREYAAGGRSSEDSVRLREYLDHAREVVHDLNNALLAVTLNSAMLLDAVGERLETSAIAHDLRESVREATEIAHELEQKVVSRSPTISVNRTVDQLVDEQRRMTASTIEFIVDHSSSDREPDMPQVALRRVLRNLLVNAREALGEGPGAIFVTMTSRGNWVDLEVRDTGPGVALENIGRLWTSGFSTKGAGRGTGLASVRSLVERHRGTIELKSADATGATFLIRLPVRSS